MNEPEKDQPARPKRERSTYGEPTHYYGRPPPPYYGGDAYYGGDPYGRSAGATGIDAIQLLRVARRKWKTIALVTILAVLGAAGYLKSAVPLYRANALLEMNVRRPRIVQSEAVIESGWQDTERLFNTRLAKFRSLAMTDRAVEKFFAMFPRAGYAEEEIARLAGAVSWKVDGKAYVLSALVVHPDPLLAADMANALAACAVDMMKDENQAGSDNAVSWLKSQAIEQRAQLAATEDALVKNREAIQLDATRSRKLAVEASLLKQNEEKVSLEHELATQESLLEFLTKLRELKQGPEILPEGMPNQEELAANLDDWSSAKMVLAGAARRYTAIHPKYQRAQEAVDAAAERSAAYADKTTKRLETRLVLLRYQLVQLDKRITDTNKEAVDLELRIVRGESQLQSLSREREAADVAYRGILNRIEEARLAADENTATVSLLQNASVPGVPFKPRPARILFMALLLGLAGGAGLAVLVEFVEDHIRGNEDVESILGVTVLGIVPLVKKKNRQQIALASHQDKFGELAESFAAVRGMMGTDPYRDLCGSVLVTSTTPEVGKTVVSSNLAISSAKSGLRTLLVDFDLRRPQIGPLYDLSEDSESLLHALSNGTGIWTHLPQRTDCEGLEVIRTRAAKDLSPAELIGGKNARDFLSWAKEAYDRVIVDSPPYGIVGDAAVLAGLVDSVVIICRPGRSRRRATRHVVRHFREVGANILGAVINGVDLRRGGGYYHHAYDRYGYKYGKKYYTPSGKKE